MKKLSGARIVIEALIQENVKVILIHKIMQLNMLNKKKDKLIFWNYKLDNK